MGELIAKLQGFRVPWRLSIPSDLVTRALHVMTFSVLALGLVLRARGFLIPSGGNSLWFDEAAWAIMLLDDPLSELLTRPIGFMAITKLLVKVIGAYDAVFRLLAWLGGVATVLMAVPIARRLFRSGASRLLFVSILALDPSAIDLSKEFKPYALGLAIHAGMLLLALRYRESGSKRDLVAACALVLPSVLFAQDTIFAYPGLFFFLGLQALRSRQARHLAAIGVAALVTLGLVAGMYFFVWNRIDKNEEKHYWAEKYDVFFDRKLHPEGKAEWFGRHYAQLTAVPGLRREVWNDRLRPKMKLDLSHIDPMVWFILHIAGVTLLVRRKRLTEGLLLYLPILVMSLFNLAGYWPFGVFRTNLFALLYIAAIAAVAVDRDAVKTRLWDFGPAAVLVLLPLLLFEEGWHSRKEMLDMTMPSWFEDASHKLIAMQGTVRPERPELLVLDRYARHSADFYLKYHETLKRTLGPEFEQRFRVSLTHGNPRKDFKEIRRALGRGQERAWLLLSNKTTIELIDSKWPRDLDVNEVVHLGGTEELLMSVGKRRTASPAIN